MPGIGVRTATRILIDIGDGSNFKTAGHLTAYAGPGRVSLAGFGFGFGFGSGSGSGSRRSWCTTHQSSPNENPVAWAAGLSADSRS